MRKILIFALLIGAVLSLSSCAKKRTPYIGENGNWWIGKNDLGVSASGVAGERGPMGESGEKGEKGDTGAIGPSGPQGAQGEAGEKGDPGEKGKDGAAGVTPHIGINGNWWIGEVDTGVFVGAYAEKCSDGLVFEFQTLSGKAGAVIIGYRGTDTEVIIPNAFSSVPVIGVEASAFAGNREITSVRLSANTVYLAKGVFEGCDALIGVDFNGAPIQTIPERAFAGTSIKNIKLPNGVETIESLAFSSVMNTIVCIPSSVSYVSDSFSESAYLLFASDLLPSGLERIASGERKVRYMLGADIASAVYDPEMKAHLVMENGGYTLLSCMADCTGVFTFPDLYNDTPIRRICEGALICAPSVTALVLGEGVTRLDASAIVSESGLKSVYFPRSLTDFSAASLSLEAEFYLFGAKEVPSGFSKERSFAGLNSSVVGSSESYLYALHPSGVSLLRFFGNEPELSIPSSIEGKPVTAIKSGFFEGYYTSVIRIPDSVHTVEKHSFHFVSHGGIYYPCTFYFAAKDPTVLFYDRDFLLIDPLDSTERSVFFNGVPAWQFGWV